MKTAKTKLCGGFSALSVVLILVVVATIGGAGYFVYTAKDNTKSPASTSAGKSASATAEKTDAGHTHDEADHEVVIVADAKQLVTGQADFNDPVWRGKASDMYLDAYINPGAGFSEVWVEYGTAVDKLAKQTAHDTERLGVGQPDTYANHSFVVDKGGLQPGTQYFYRAVGKLGDGDLVRGGIASFISRK